MIYFNAFAWTKYVSIPEKKAFHFTNDFFRHRLIALILVTIKLPYSCTYIRKSTRRYFFDAVADFDDIVENNNNNNYEWKSKFNRAFSERISSTSSYHKKRSTCPDQKSTVKTQANAETENPHFKLDQSRLRKMSLFRRNSDSNVRALPTFVPWKRSQDSNEIPFEKCKSHLVPDRRPDGGFYYVRAIRPNEDSHEYSADSSAATSDSNEMSTDQVVTTNSDRKGNID